MTRFTGASRPIGNFLFGPGWNTLPVLACLAVFFLACQKETEQSAQPAVPVVVARVEQKTVPLEITAIGTVEAFSTVSINPRVGGEIVRVFFEEGRDVGQGEPLFQIDPAPYRAALDGSQASLARDSVKALNAEENVRRYAELVQKDYITRQQYDDLLADAEALKATVREDRAALENARLNLGYCLIRAPIKGRAGGLLVHQGNIIKANGDSPLVVIHQLEPVYARFTVPEQYLAGILNQYHSSGLEVRAYLPEQGREPKTGRVSFVDNAVDQSTGTIAMKAVFANEDKLLWPGQFVNILLVLRMIRNAVVVPSRAVQSGQDGDYVFVVKDDKTVESRPVTVSYNTGQQTVVDKGLQPGETVVADGQLRLFPGARIEETEGLDNGKAGGK